MSGGSLAELQDPYEGFDTDYDWDQLAELREEWEKDLMIVFEFMRRSAQNGPDLLVVLVENDDDDNLVITKDTRFHIHHYYPIPDIWVISVEGQGVTAPRAMKLIRKCLNS